jgi:Rrf2 family iron-responsive transcriptional regulator
MLKLSKKWSYALKAVIYIAKYSPDMVKIKDISISQNISETLLRRLIADLEKNWVIKTIKGRNGGVVLWKAVEIISIYDILKSVWEELWITDCTRGIDCWNINTCSTTEVLSSLQRGFNSILKLHTLDKIIK